MNAPLVHTATTTPVEYGVCSHCDQVLHNVDLDQTSYIGGAASKVFDLHTSKICNDCMNDLEEKYTDCGGCGEATDRNDCRIDDAGDHICWECVEWDAA